MVYWLAIWKFDAPCYSQLFPDFIQNFQIEPQTQSMNSCCCVYKFSDINQDIIFNFKKILFNNNINNYLIAPININFLGVSSRPIPATLKCLSSSWSVSFFCVLILIFIIYITIFNSRNQRSLLWVPTCFLTVVNNAVIWSNLSYLLQLSNFFTVSLSIWFLTHILELLSLRSSFNFFLAAQFKISFPHTNIGRVGEKPCHEQSGTTFLNFNSSFTGSFRRA